ncbi:MAG: FAD-dependent oxidoreductase [Thermodesulfovibrionales bacterium]|nr:FAD-dependent oxidoreductase [Thermodesulfovibrionales bacterium]
MQEPPELYDVLIIGGGPAGLTAGQYASRAKLKTIILDKSPTAGALAYSSKIENYPGLPHPLPGKELLDIMRNQATGFGAEYVETQVVGVNVAEDRKEVITMNRAYSGKTLIIATGSMGRKPTIKGEGEFLGKGVSYCAICDAAFYRGLKVCVIGNSEEAVKEAKVLTRFAETVYLISPTPKIHADEASLDEPGLKVLLGYTVTSIEGSGLVERIRMRDPENKETELELAGVFVYLHGNKPVVDFLFGAVETQEDGCIPVHSMMETSIPGVFAAGDVTCTEVRQVVVAASQGCLAALSAEKYIFKRKKLKSDWAK